MTSFPDTIKVPCLATKSDPSVDRHPVTSQHVVVDKNTRGKIDPSAVFQKKNEKFEKNENIEIAVRR